MLSCRWSKKDGLKMERRGRLKAKEKEEGDVENGG